MAKEAQKFKKKKSAFPMSYKEAKGYAAFFRRWKVPRPLLIKAL